MLGDPRDVARRLVLLVAASIAVSLVASDSPVARNTSQATPAAGEALVQLEKLIGSRKDAINFGSSVAISEDGNTLLIGAPRDGEQGAAWALRRRGQTWTRVKLTAGGSTFGSSVALSANGRVALVGDPGFDDGRGAAHVFSLVGCLESLPASMRCSRQATLRGTGRKGKAAFGWSVALSADGRRALVGGPYDDRGRFDRLKPFAAALGTAVSRRFRFTKSAGKGAAWAFQLSADTGRWVKMGGKLTASDARGRAMFGFSVALCGSGHTALIGGPADRNDRGAAWVLRYEGPLVGWRQQARLTGGAGEPKYGFSLAASRDCSVALVGAPADRNWRGAALVATGAGGWANRATLRGTGWFGFSVALAANGSTGLVGAPTGEGEAWAVTQFGSSWARRKLARSGTVGLAVFGASCALSADGLTAVIGGPLDRQRKGAAWVFGTPPVVAEVVPSGGPTAGGTSVRIRGRGFHGVEAVRFGTIPAASFAVDSPTQITATSPPRRAGPVDITVTTPVATSVRTSAGRFTYFDSPVVTTVTPNTAATDVETTVTISGTGFLGATAVRFGANPAASFTVESATQIRAVAPPASAGTVDVTVTTPGGTSAATAGSRFTYVAFPEHVISFDELTTGGLQGGGARVVVDDEYAARGVTFNSVTAIDYSRNPGALPGFARSGTIGVEQCFGVEFCMTPVRATFSAPQRMVRVWVGFSFALNVPAQVQLRALDASSAVVGTATAILQPNSNPTPIRTPLEVRVGAAAIRQLEVTIVGGFTNALAIDDVTFQGG